MRPFRYQEATNTAEAARAVAHQPNAMFLAGGTTLVDLMKIDVLTPETVIDVGQLALNAVEVEDDGILVGANVRNNQLAWHPVIRERFPVLSEALLSGATTQLRNMATVAGNIMQRTRCPYFRDVHAACNRRVRGSGCDAMLGFHRSHAVLGTSDSCIATHPSDMCVAMVILDAVIHTLKPDGTTRAIAFSEFHRTPGDTPDVETNLEHGELITHVVLPTQTIARRSHYLKVRDRASYEFALSSAAVALDLDGDTITAARIGLGGVATKPWRCFEAEQLIAGKEATDTMFERAADVALAPAIGREHNRFKITLAKRTIVRALITARDLSL
jgi:xanthine dehydrogenase YagS FAD-binding subunit